MTAKRAPKRVVGYVRISREHDDSTSIDRQREIIATYCRAHDLTLVDTIADADVSASKKRLDRPGLSRVRALIRSGDVERSPRLALVGVAQERYRWGESGLSLRAAEDAEDVQYRAERFVLGTVTIHKAEGPAPASFPG